MRRVVRPYLLLVSFVPALVGRSLSGHAQADRLAPAFEVESIKPAQERALLTGPVPPDRFVRRYITLPLLLLYAYDVAEFQIEGGDAWTKTSRFDIEAKADGQPRAEQMRAMVRRLLAERFALRVHSETRELPRYALVKARPDGQLGSKLRRSTIDCPAIASAPGYRPPVGPPQAGDGPRCRIGFGLAGGVRTMYVTGFPISQFVRILQPEVGRVVTDRTGLTGTYDLEVESEIPSTLGSPSSPTVPSTGVSLFTALQEQLGLKLESERGPVRVLVIDHVERPTPD